MTTRADLIENVADCAAVVREMEQAGYHDGYFGLVEAREAERQARCELSAWERQQHIDTAPADCLCNVCIPH